MSRRRSVSSQENDERLLEAALAEIVEVGVDRLGMSGVARRAGLTTGALYGRYENVNELAAAVWTARVRDAHFQFLDRVIHALVDGDPSASLAGIARELSSPSAVTIAALELLAMARRIDELEEVVTPDVESWLTRWRVGPRVRDRRRRAQALFALGAVWGVILHAMPKARPVEWEPMFARTTRSFAQPYDEPGDRFVAEAAGAVRANVGDASQNALIDSVSAIAARVGFDRATASRIARRANLTSGAIYARYETKSELLSQAVEVLLAQRLADDLVANTYLFTAPDVGRATASVIGGYLSAPRRDWRIFRVEAQLAARHHAELAATLDRVQEAAIRAYLEALGANSAEEHRALDALARFAQAIPLGLAFVDLVAPAVSTTDWRAVFVPLLAPEPF
ncbi:MAG TPA: TetR/AcrR family transcriptional regulator [Acidimicrobiia bacterium]|nr:TetR/AcrR family transcriptional regulator [Acidimicrobiia bacterium]